MAQLEELTVKLKADSAEFAAGLEHAKTKLHGFNGALSDYGANVRRVGDDMSGKLVMAFAAVSAAISATAVKSVVLAGELEQTRIAFTTMLGSADAADRKIKELFDFAKRTPFQIKDVISGARQLTAYGFEAEKIIPILTAVGNAAAGLALKGEGIDRIVIALGQMVAKGAISGEEMRQLAQAGIPAWQMLADIIGTDIPHAMKLAEDRALPAAEIIDAMIIKIGERYPNLMEKQSKTLLGLWSNLQDQGTLTFMAIGTAITEAFDLKGRLGNFISDMEKITEVLTTQGIGAALDKLFPQDTRDKIGLISGAIIGALVPAFYSLGAAIVSATWPLIPFVAAGALAAVAWQQNWGDIQGKVKDFTDWFVPMIQNELLPAIQDIIWRAQDLVKEWTAKWGNIQTYLRDKSTPITSDLRDIATAVELIGNTATVTVTALGALAKGIAALPRPEGLMEWIEAIQNPGAFVGRKLGARAAGASMEALYGPALREDTSAAEAAAKRYNDELEATWRLTHKIADAEAELNRTGHTGEIISEDDAFRRFNDTAEDVAEAVGSKLSTAFNIAGGAIKKVGLAVGDLVAVLVASHPATLMAAAAVEGWKQRIDEANLALEANADQIKAAQVEYQGMQDHLAELNNTLADLKTTLTDLSNPQLTGMGGMDDKINAVEKQLKRLQFAAATGLPIEEVMKMFPILTTGMEAYIGQLPNAIRGTADASKAFLDSLKAMKDLKFSEQLDLIKKAAGDAKKEMDYADVIKQIGETKLAITNTTTAINLQETALKAQKDVIEALQKRGEELNETLRGYQRELKIAEDFQKDLNAALKDAYQSFLDDKTKMEAMGAAGITAAGEVDSAMRTLLSAVQGYVNGVSADISATLASVRSQVDAIKGNLAGGGMTIQGVGETGLPPSDSAKWDMAALRLGTSKWFNPALAGGAFKDEINRALDDYNVAIKQATALMAADQETATRNMINATNALAAEMERVRAEYAWISSKPTGVVPKAISYGEQVDAAANAIRAAANGQMQALQAQIIGIEAMYAGMPFATWPREIQEQIRSLRALLAQYQRSSQYGLPSMAGGGVVLKAMLARVGEGGEPEVVAPLSKLPEILARVGAMSGGGNISNQSVSVYQTTKPMSPVEAREQYIRAMRSLRYEG